MADLVPHSKSANVPTTFRVGNPHRRDTGDDDEIHLVNVLRVLARRKGIVLAGVVLTVGAAAYVSARRVPTYQANAVIRVADERQSLTGGLDIAAQQVTGGRQAVDPILSHLQVLRSSSVLGDVVDREGLRLTPLTRGLRPGDLEVLAIATEAPVDTLELTFDAAGVRGRLGGAEARAAYGEPLALAGVELRILTRPELESAALRVRHRQDAIDQLNRNVTVRPREQTDIVDIQYTSTDPRVAQRVTNTLVAVFQDHNLRAARQESQRRRVFVEEQLELTDSLLDVAQNSLSEFRERERVFSSRERFAAQQTGLLQLEVRKEELEANRGMYSSILSNLEGAETGEVARRLEVLIASPEIAQNPVIANLFGQVVRLESLRDSLTSGGASQTNPDLARVDQQIRATTDRIENAVRSHLLTLEAQVAALNGLFRRMEDDIENLPAVEAEEARLVQGVESIRRTVDLMREEQQKARIAEAVEVGQVEIVDLAALPRLPLERGRRVTLVLAVVLGLMLGSGAVYVVENMDTRIKGRDDVEKNLKVPGLGVIPRIEPSRNGRLGRTVPALLRRAGLPLRKSHARANGNGVKSGQELVTVVASNSSTAEAFRTLRTNLLYADIPGGIRTLVVTSPMPADGKTITSANLAVTYAQQGKRVLLMDCDLRKGRLADLFGLSRAPGLSELVLGRARPAEVAHETAIEGLWVIPSGTLPPNPTELLGGARMRKALDALAQSFDLVVLDTAPLAAGADAAILGAAADGVVLVVRAGQTNRDAGQQAVRQLDTVGARVLGAVINDPEGQGFRYAGYYTYEYGYGKYARSAD